MQPDTGRALRVAVLVDEVSPFRVAFFEQLERRGIEATVLPYTRYAPLSGRRDPGDLPFRHRHLDSLVIRLRRGNLHPRIVYLPIRLPGALRAINPDVVVAYAYSVPTWVAMAYCGLLGRGLVLWSEGTHHTERNISRVQKAIRRFVIPRCDAYVVPSRGAKDRLCHFGADPERVFSIVHAADLRLFAPEDSFRAPDTPQRILYVGRLVAAKGLWPLLESFSLILRCVPDVRLALVGEGALADALRGRASALGIAGSIDFFGYRAPRELGSIYRSSDLFVFPSLEDTFGHVVAEAVASGLPVVCSPYAGAASEMVEQGRNGYIADPAEPADFARPILEILRSPQLRRSMAGASREIALRIGTHQAVSNLVRAIRLADRAGYNGK